MESLKNLPLKPMLIMSVLSVILWTGLGFSWTGYGFGWVTSGSVQKLVDQAMLETQVDVCVGQAMADAESGEKLAKLKALKNSYSRSNFVKDAEWDILPGQTKSNSRVRSLCTDRLNKS